MLTSAAIAADAALIVGDFNLPASVVSRTWASDDAAAAGQWRSATRGDIATNAADFTDGAAHGCESRGRDRGANPQQSA